MVKPRFCPSRDQSSPGQLIHPLGFGQVLSDQPAASRLEHCELVLFDTGTIGLCCRVECLVRIWNFSLSDPKDCGLSRGDPNDCGPRSVESSFFWPLWYGDRILPIERRNTMSPGPRGLWNPRVSVAPTYGVTKSRLRVEAASSLSNTRLLIQLCTGCKALCLDAAG
ncbi:unnamed protein product [Brassica rapa subsp. narinosa]